MRNLKIETKINKPIDFVWSVLADVENYPKYVKHIYRAKAHGPLVEGSTWSDWTTILFLPLKITHTTSELVEPRRLHFTFPTPFEGQVNQLFTLRQEGRATNVRFEISIDLGNKLVDFLLGSILEQRWRSMISAAVANLGKEFNGS